MHCEHLLPAWHYPSALLHLRVPPIIVGGSSSMDRTTRRVRDITIFCKNSTKIVSTQTVNVLVTMYVGAPSQHALRTTCVMKKRINDLRMKSSNIGHDASTETSTLLFVVPLKLRGLGVASAVQRRVAASWRSLPNTLIDHKNGPDVETGHLQHMPRCQRCWGRTL